MRAIARRFNRSAPGRLPPWEIDDPPGLPSGPGDWPPSAFGDWPDPPDDSLEDLLARCPRLADEVWLGADDPEWADDPEPMVREVLKAGFWARTRGDGAGFAVGGVLGTLPPGPALAGFARGAWADGLGRLTDDELVGVLRAARRLASWAGALELAAAGDLFRRRMAEEDAGDTGAACHADDEIAAALTLTAHAAGRVLELAVALGRLPLTSAALAAGDVDLPRAAVIADEVTGLDDAHAAVVDRAVAGAAPGLTTGQVRAATRRAVFAADPTAAQRRKEEALHEARVERTRAGPRGNTRDGPGPARAGGTTAGSRGRPRTGHTGFDAGDPGESTDLSREGAATVPPGTATPRSVDRARTGPRDGPRTSPCGPAHVHRPGTAASSSGDRARTGPPGPPPASTHGQPAIGPSGWTWTFAMTVLGRGDCDHAWETAAYQPTGRLRHLLHIRHATCTYPGCRRPARHCDQDHTLAYDQGGRTCLCNLAPLCRHHHQVKQAHGWTLEQASPGVLTWTTPAGRRYTVTPTEYPA